MQPTGMPVNYRRDVWISAKGIYLDGRVGRRIYRFFLQIQDTLSLSLSLYLYLWILKIEARESKSNETEGK